MLKTRLLFLFSILKLRPSTTIEVDMSDYANTFLSEDELKIKKFKLVFDSHWSKKTCSCSSQKNLFKTKYRDICKLIEYSVLPGIEHGYIKLDDSELLNGKLLCMLTCGRCSSNLHYRFQISSEEMQTSLKWSDYSYQKFNNGQKGVKAWINNEAHLLSTKLKIVSTNLAKSIIKIFGSLTLINLLFLALFPSLPN